MFKATYMFNCRKTFPQYIKHKSSNKIFFNSFTYLLKFLHVLRKNGYFCGIIANFFLCCFMSEKKIVMAVFNTWIF